MEVPAWTRRGAALLLVGLLPLAASACTPLTSRPSSGGPLVLYNGQHLQTTEALVRAFERRTGVRVSIRSDDEDLLADQIAQEGARSPADVIYTENSPALAYLQGAGLLAPVERSTLDQVSPRYRSPKGDWVGVSARVSVLVYNTSLVPKSELPRSVLDLAERRWDGRLAIAPTETDFQPIVTSVADARGKRAAISWLRGIARNGAAHEYQDDETVTAAVNSGQAAIGVVNQYYWYRLRAQLGRSGMHSAIAWFAPRDPGYVLDVSGAAIVRSTRHRREAQELLAFLVSRRGQEVMARSDSFEYPLADGVLPAEHQPPLARLRPYPISAGRLGTGAEALSLMRRAGVLP